MSPSPPSRRSVTARSVAKWLIAASLVACGHGEQRHAGTSTIAPAASGTGFEALRIDRIVVAEHAREEKSIPPDALASRDVVLRRATARALARIADEGAAERLEKGLGDEDPEVVAWSAYGLGYSCHGREEETVRRLASRAPTLPKDAVQNGRKLFELSAVFAVADALARCGGLTAERILTSWLEGPRSDRTGAAMLALGRLAGAQHRLSDEAIVALLDRAAAAEGDPEALYPFTRLEAVSEATNKRLADVARQALSAGGVRRTFAVRALAAAGDAGIQPLADAFADETVLTTDRSAAAVGLGRIATRAQSVVARALARIVKPDSTLDEHFISLHAAPLGALLSAPLWPNPEARDALARLSETALPDGTRAGLARRIVALRCGAAAALAGTASRSARLLACDPEAGGRTGALAQLRVLDRGKLEGARFARYRELLDDNDPGVRRAALALIPTHPEMPAVVDPLIRALAAPEPGIVAQAARVLATEPRRASRKPLTGRQVGNVASSSPAEPAAEADPKIVEALAHALDADRPLDQIEARVALMDAAAALGTLSLKPRIERYCRSDNVTLRKRAEKALALLGSVACPAAKREPAPLPEDPPVVTKTVTLTLLTDSDRLAMTLEPELAPVAVSRVVSLAKSGFYDHLRIHRVSPGFIAQFGDPVGDGSGGASKPPLPCETSPLDFAAFSVGVALSGRDTGSSQIFVTLSPQPQLDGDYTIIGRADPEWANAAEGDVIERVEVR